MKHVESYSHSLRTSMNSCNSCESFLCFWCRHLHCDPGRLLISTFQERSLDALDAPDLSQWSCHPAGKLQFQATRQQEHALEQWCLVYRILVQKVGRWGEGYSDWWSIMISVRFCHCCENGYFSRLVAAVPRNCHSIRPGRIQSHWPRCDLWINISLHNQKQQNNKLETFFEISCLTFSATTQKALENRLKVDPTWAPKAKISIFPGFTSPPWRRRLMRRPCWWRANPSLMRYRIGQP